MSHPHDLDTLDVEGVFWPAGEEEKQVAGRLTFSPNTGGRLKLIGRSFDIMPVALTNERPIRFNGDTPLSWITLDGCYTVRNSYAMGRTADVVFHVPMILTTLLFEKDERLDFSSIQASLRHLETWLDIRKLSRMSHGEITRQGQDTIPGHSSIAVNHPTAESASLPGGEVLLPFDYAVTGDEYTSMTLSQRAAIKFVAASNSEIYELFEMTGPVQQLLTIAADSPSVYTDIRFEHEELNRFREEDPGLEDHVRLYTRVRGSGLGGDATNLDPTKMLFTYDDIGRIEGLARWIQLANRYRVALEPLLAHKYQSTSFVGNRLVDAAGAADAYYLIRFGGEPGSAQTLRDRLIALALLAGDLFCDVVGGAEEWATHVKSARTDLTHAGERNPPRYNDAAYSALARSVYLMVILCLLRELNVTETAIAKAISTGFETLARRLHVVLEGVQPSGPQAEDPTS